MADVYIGLDCEMTGTHLDVHDICQIGVYLPGRDPFVSDVLPSRPHIFDPKALGVNGFTHERLAAGSTGVCYSWAESTHVRRLSLSRKRLQLLEARQCS